MVNYQNSIYVPALDTTNNLNLHKTFLGHPGRLLNVLLHAQLTPCVQGANKHTDVHIYYIQTQKRK